VVNGMPVNDAVAGQAALKILYFARVAELLGRREEVWPLPEPLTSGQWRQALLERYPQLTANRLKIAVNQQYARDNTTLAPGDEVAVFEPVTGG